MKFREYGKVRSVILTAKSGKDLSKKIDTLGEKYALIDLQFSTTNTNDGIEYSALALIGERIKKGD